MGLSTPPQPVNDFVHEDINDNTLQDDDDDDDDDINFNNYKDLDFSHIDDDYIEKYSKN